MKKLNITFLLFVNLSFVLFTFLFLFVKSKYAIVMFDDVLDLIIGSFYFYHGRFFSEFIAILFVKIIPNLLNIHVQNFAVVSECLLKIIIIIATVIIINKPFENTFGKINGKSWGILYLTSFFTIFAFICKYDIYLLFHTLQFNLGYVMPIPFFIVFWHKIFNVYICNEKIDKLTIYWNILLSSYIAQSNELFAFSTFFILLVILIEKKLKNESTKFILPPIIVMVIVFSFILTHRYFISVFKHYYVGFSKLMFLNNFIDFLKLYFDNLFIDNVFFITLIALCTIYLYLSNTNKKINLRVIRYILYTLCGFLLFFLFLFFIGKSCPSYGVEAAINDQNYWISYKPLLFEWRVLLFSIFIFLYSRLREYTNISKYRIFLIALIYVLSCFYYIKSELNDFNAILYSYEIKKNQYVHEKFACHYTDREEIIILPITKQSVIQDGDSQIYAQNKLYTKDSHPQVYEFLSYIERIYYNGENKTYGIIFLEEKKAYDKYKESGGVITDIELKELNFNKIKIK